MSMHVGLYSPSWPPGFRPNGIVTYVDAMRREFESQGHRVSIFSPAVAADCGRGVHRVASGPAERFRGFGRRVVGRQPTVFDIGETIASTIRRVHRRDPIDVIEMEESFGWALQVASGTGLPVVVRLHGPAFLTMVREELETSLGAAKVEREGAALKNLPVIVSPSRCTLDETLLRYQLRPRVAEKVVNPIASSLELPLWNPGSCHPGKILFVGRFDKVKGADVLVRAFQKLVAVKPDAKLEFVGPDGGLAEQGRGNIHLAEFVAALADSAVERNLVYRGSLPPHEITALRQTAALTVIASRRENQPYSALEAMLQACPVVCTDTSGLSELIDHEVTGLKAKPEDPSDLALQMQRIIDDPALGRALGLAARDHVLSQHAPSIVVRQALEIYRRAIDLHSSSAVARRR